MAPTPTKGTPKLRPTARKSVASLQGTPQRTPSAPKRRAVTPAAPSRTLTTPKRLPAAEMKKRAGLGAPSDAKASSPAPRTPLRPPSRAPATADNRTPASRKPVLGVARRVKTPARRAVSDTPDTAVRKAPDRLRSPALRKPSAVVDDPGRRGEKPVVSGARAPEAGKSFVARMRAPAGRAGDRPHGPTIGETDPAGDAAAVVAKKLPARRKGVTGVQGRDDGDEGQGEAPLVDDAVKSRKKSSASKKQVIAVQGEQEHDEVGKGKALVARTDGAAVKGKKPLVQKKRTGVKVAENANKNLKRLKKNPPSVSPAQKKRAVTAKARTGVRVGDEEVQSPVASAKKGETSRPVRLSRDECDDSSSAAEDAGSPGVVFNTEMTEGKLRLIESSPLRRVISSNDRRAAAAEVAARKAECAAQEKEAVKHARDEEPEDVISSDAGEDSGPVQGTSRDTEEQGIRKKKKKASDNLEAVKRKEARTIKWKARQLKKRGELCESDSSTAGVMYLGHIPHGFYEEEMRGYFSQFGEVLRVRLSRSKKTARSRGFAFLEFADKDVATIAAEAMDGYLMHGQALVAKFVPKEKVHPSTFKGANRTFKKKPWSAMERRAMIQRARDPMKLAERSKHVRKATSGKRKALKKKGIDYEYPEVQMAS